MEHQTSRLAYGTVLHHAMHVLERYGDTQKAIDTFLHYWHPLHIDALTAPVPRDGWVARDSYGELRKRGVDVIRKYADLLEYDKHELLGLEFDFVVPLVGLNVRFDGETRSVWMAGTIDRLAVRWYRQRETLCVDDWKGLALDTPLPTPTGWTDMASVQRGDQLLGVDGKPCTVLETSEVHHRPCYRVTFDDGGEVIADNVHLWEVWTGRKADKREVLSTEQMAQRVFSEETGQRDLRVPNPDPLDLPNADLPIDPYVLGAWLGDGTRERGVITNPDQGVWDEIERRGYEIGKRNDDGKCRQQTVIGLRTQLREAGLIDGDKRLPSVYLRGSLRQRFDLLRGLMDTDGTWNVTRKHAVFCTTDPALSAAVCELVLTMGWVPRVFKTKHEGFGLEVDAYDVCFTPDGNPFLLQRKAELVTEAPTRSKRRIVKSVEPVESVPTRCVKVDSPRSLYLAGSHMLPTHNTGQQKWNLRHNVQGTAYCYATLQEEFFTGAEVEGIRLGSAHGARRGEVKRYKSVGFADQDPLNERFDSRADELIDRFAGGAPRRFTWINLRTFKVVDGGYRGPQDFARLKTAVSQVAGSVDADVFPLRIDGETCTYCTFRRTCGGTGVPDDTHADPALHFQPLFKD